MADFDPEAFEQFIDEILPEDRQDILTIDETAAVLRQVRDWLERHDVEMAHRRHLAELIVAPWLQARTAAGVAPVTGAERLALKRQFSEAIGFDIPLPN
jgi:hypothetical protein